MIKKIFLLTFIHLFIFNIHSQSTFVPEWNVGLGFGPTFSSLDFQQDNGYSKKVRTKGFQQFSGGVAVRYISEKNLGVIGELNFSQQGWNEEFDPDTDLGYEYKRTLNYIEMPIMTHIYFGNQTRFFVNLGPKIQFLISEKEKINQVLSNAINMENMKGYEYGKDADYKFDYGITAGLGMEFRTKAGSFSLEGRYYFGLGDVFNNRQGQSDYSRSANRVISAKLTYYTKLF